MNSFEYVTATTPAQALALLAEVPATPGAGYAAAPTRLLAGGTDLLPLMKERLAAPARLIDLKAVRELRAIRLLDDGSLHIGALATLAEVERDRAVDAHFPILRLAVREAATPQLRNAATVGGNLLQRNRCWYFRGEMRCWLRGGDECFAREGRNDHHAILGTGPCIAVNPSDLAPALIALDATVAIQGPRGERVMPVAELFQAPTEDARIEHRVAPDELIVELRVPPQPEGARGTYIKVMERAAWAFALVSAAVQLSQREGRIERVRLVLGGVAPVPWRVPEAETLLEGRSLTPELAAQAAEQLVDGAAPLTHNAYKVPLAREVARRALLQAAGMPG